jgi:hypothetical protein
MPSDLHVALDAFAALCLMEGLVKPVAIRLTRWLLARADRWAQHVLAGRQAKGQWGRVA